MSSAPATSPTPLRHRVSLQTRLIATVVSFVALILIAVALATGALLGQILQQQLDNAVQDAANRASVRLLSQPGSFAGAGTALSTLQQARGFPSGFLLVVQSAQATDGAYISDDKVHPLSPESVDEVISSLSSDRFVTMPLEDLGLYRLSSGTIAGTYLITVGLPVSTMTNTITEIVVTVALVSTGGLLVLSAIIAFVIRRALRPLRVVSETAVRVASQPLSSGDVAITVRVPRTEADAADEIGSVGAALNVLLDHVDASLAQRQRNEELMRSFVADASHELRTPLAAIRGYSELSLRSLRAGAGDAGVGAAQTQEGLERIQAASLRMTTLVEDLLLLARLDEGQELVYGTVDLSRVVVDAVTDAQAAGADHEWVIDIPEEPIVVAGDATRLHQVIANLLTNARVHTPAGTRVRASASLTGSEAVLRVSDNGPGIDPGVADELFERFARADTSRARQTGGTGLGLSIAKAIVTAHGGTITVTSEPGDTVFEVRLPARPAAPEQTAAQ